MECLSTNSLAPNKELDPENKAAAANLASLRGERPFDVSIRLICLFHEVDKLMMWCETCEKSF